MTTPWSWAAAALIAALLIAAVSAHRRVETVEADSGRPQAAPRKPDPIKLAERDWDAARAEKTLTVTAPYNSTSYFIYRGEPMGYEYELLKAFAADHHLRLRMLMERDGDRLFPLLREGKADIVAARLPAASEKDAAEEGIEFTRGLYRTRPAVVQRENGTSDGGVPEPVEEIIERKEGEGALKPVRIGVRPITRPSELAGEKVHLPKGSTYRRTLIELSDEISGDVEVVEVGGDANAEALIDRVSKGKVRLTVAQKNLADLQEHIYTNIEVVPTVGPPHSVAWAVRKNSPQLLAELNRWIEAEKNSGLFRRLYRKYFVDQRNYRLRVASEYLSSKTGKLSRYDRLMKQYAPRLDWDWRLLASLAFQESRFEPDARSWAGAGGLLQLMPQTARGFGVRNRFDPQDNVRGGVRFLDWLEEYWDDRITDKEERLKFVLASYNAGPGHVEDGRRLAAKHGDDPQKWDDVAYWMLQLSKKKHYADPVVRHGFCRGMEPVTYVGLILDRFDHYRQFVVT
jgi:membrane-bound lytic murein transglycosylase F